MTTQAPMICIDSDDPLGGSVSSDQDAPQDPFGSDEELPAKVAAFEPSLNLTVYKIPAYNNECNGKSAKENINKSYQAQQPSVKIYPNSYNTTPVRFKKNGEVAKKRGPPKGYKRKAKVDNILSFIPNISPSLTITPVPAQPTTREKLPQDTGLTITPTPYQKQMTHPGSDKLNNTDLKPNGYKTPFLPIPVPTVGEMAAMTQALSHGSLSGLSLAQRNAILSTLLMGNAVKMTTSANVQEMFKQLGLATGIPASLSITPEPVPIRYAAPIIPKGVEVVLVECEPGDWFPDEPYRMSFSRKKNQKWKSFPHQCEHCFKGYRVASSLVTHAGERHGAVPRSLAIPCPCCQHVSVRRKQHRRHVSTHAVRKNRLFCLYCVPPQDPSEPYLPETQRYPIDEHPSIYYSSEESLRLHRKRKHPEAAYLNTGWNYTWMNPATYS